MPKLLSFLEKSVQWVALGLAGVFLLLCVYWYVLTPPATTKIGGKAVAPADIDDLTQSQVAQIEKEVKTGTASDAVKPPDLITPWKTAMTSPPPITIADRWHSTPDRDVIHISGPNGPTDLITAVAALPKATPVSVQAGLSVVAPLKGPNGQDVPGAVPSDILWASAAFSISAGDLKTVFEKPLEKKDPSFAKFYRTAYLSVELQRQAAIGHDATGTPVFPDGEAGVERVEIPKIDQTDIQPLPDPKSSDDTKNQFAQWAEANQTNICQPKFYTTTMGTTYSPAVLIGQPGAPGAAPGAAPAPAAVVPRQQQAGIDPFTLPNDQLVWAHDDTVKAGRSYRYRVVYHMKNPVFALQNIADQKILHQLDAASLPSDWTGPITIPPDVKYWVTALPHNGTAQIDYFKWEAGSWKMTKNMALSPGDTIPGTDQTIVDIHNAPSPRPKEQYVLLTDSFGEALRHIPKDDRDDPALKQCINDATGAAAAGAKAAGGGPAPVPPRNGAAAPRGNR
jgi:hypothetical protein